MVSDAPHTVRDVNPAKELAALLVSWRPQEVTPWEARVGAAGGDTLVAWRAQGRAAALLREVDQALDALRAAGEDTEAFDPWVEEWHEAVFSYRTTWRERTSAPLMRPEALSLLQAFGLLLDRNVLPPLDERRRSALLAALDDVEGLLGSEADRLSEADREYLWRLVNGAREFVAETAVRGAADLREHLDRLSGALLSMAARFAEAGDEETARTFGSVAVKIATGARTVLGVAADLATVAAAAAPIMLALTPH